MNGRLQHRNTHLSQRNQVINKFRNQNICIVISFSFLTLFPYSNINIQYYSVYDNGYYDPNK